VGPARPGADARREEIAHVTVRVEVDEPLTVAALALEHDREIAVTRLKREDEPGPVTVPAPEEPVTRGDLLTIVGPPDLLETVALRLGHVSSHDIVADRRDLDFRRVTLSSKPLVGHTVG
jgi:putative transport protein